MPFISVSTNVAADSAKRTSLLQDLSSKVSGILGKPEAYLMATIQQCEGIMGGDAGTLAFVELRGIGGLTTSVNKALSAAICTEVKRHLGIEGSRVYVNFFEVAAENWGCDGGTFG